MTMRDLFYSDPFTLLDSVFPTFPTAQKVVVISDSEYRKYQRDRAEQEITALESKRNRLNSSIEEIELKIHELEEECALLPYGESKEKPKKLK